MAKIFNWTKGINQEELEIVIKTLGDDGIIIFPTDTVYGIGCNCFSEKAIQKLFKIKERNYKKPINTLTNNIEKIQKVAKNISIKHKELINKYMPGALTIILDKKEGVPELLTSNLQTIGVRIPNNKIALEILKNFDLPLATTSVNISGNNPGIEIEDFIEEFENKVDIIIDGGKSQIGIASTIISINNDNDINILRQGSIKI